MALLVERRTLGGRLWRFVLLPILLLPLPFALIFHWPPGMLPAYLIVLTAVGIFSLLMQPLRRWMNARALADVPHMRQVTYRFGDAGIRLSTPVTSAEIAWAAVQQVVETDDMFLIFLGRRFAYYVPRRVVGDRAASLRSALRAHLGTRAELRP